MPSWLKVMTLTSGWFAAISDRCPNILWQGWRGVRGSVYENMKPRTYSTPAGVSRKFKYQRRMSRTERRWILLTYDAQNSMMSTFLFRQPSREPCRQMNESWSIQSKLTLLPSSGLLHPGRRKGGGPFFNCASTASQGGIIFLYWRASRTARLCRFLNSAVLWEQ